jgi:hypothetical protein
MTGMLSPPFNSESGQFRPVYLRGYLASRSLDAQQSHTQAAAAMISAGACSTAWMHLLCLPLHLDIHWHHTGPSPISIPARPPGPPSPPLLPKTTGTRPQSPSDKIRYACATAQVLFAALIAVLRRRELALARYLVQQDWSRYKTLWATVLSADPAAVEHAAAVAAEASRLVSGPACVPRQMVRACRSPADRIITPAPAPRLLPALRTWLSAAAADAAAGLASRMTGGGMEQRGGLEAGLALDVERFAEGGSEAPVLISSLDQLFTQVCELAFLNATCVCARLSIASCSSGVPCLAFDVYWVVNSH